MPHGSFVPRHQDVSSGPLGYTNREPRDPGQVKRGCSGAEHILSRMSVPASTFMREVALIFLSVEAEEPSGHGEWRDRREFKGQQNRGNRIESL